MPGVDRFVLDSNVFDKLLLEPDVASKLQQLVDREQVVVLSPPVQRRELSRTRDVVKRAQLLELLDRLAEDVPEGGGWAGDSPTEEVPKGELATAKWGEFTWLADDFDTVLRTTKDGKPRHTEDALIAHAARDNQAILVTAETATNRGGRMLKVPPSVGIETWPWDRFRAWVLSRV